MRTHEEHHRRGRVCVGRDHEHNAFGGSAGRGRSDHGRGPGHRGSRRRMVDANGLALILLHLAEAQPRHGYEVIREIESLTGGAYAPSPGIIYPTLTLLEELGQLEMQAEGAKRQFALTEAGRARLAEQKDQLDVALARLHALREEGGRREAGPVWRAMQNLKAVLEPRLSTTIERQALFEIADVIDEAARKIERL